MGFPGKLQFLENHVHSARSKQFTTAVMFGGKSHDVTCANMSWGGLCGHVYPEYVAPPPTSPPPTQPPMSPPPTPSTPPPPSPTPSSPPPPPPKSPKPSSPPPPPCVDEKSEEFCVDAVSKGRCAYDPVTQNFCQKSCGICNEFEYICADLSYRKDLCTVRKAEDKCDKKYWENICRVTCGACSPKADDPKVCIDKWGDRYCNWAKSKDLCDTDERVSLRCERTCGHCQKARCTNFRQSKYCDEQVAQGKCTTDGKVQARCRKACNLCGVWDVSYNVSEA